MGHSSDRKGIHLVKWSDICQLIANGGLNILNLSAQNQTFIAKLIFKIHAEPHLTWVQVLQHKYNFSPDSDLPQRTSPSPFWRNISRCWSQVRSQIKWHPGDGKSTKFWLDYWVGEHGPLLPISLAAIPADDRNLSVADYWDTSSWKWDLFDRLLPSATLQSIRTSRLLPLGTSPSCSWAPSSSGSFLTSSAYHHLVSSSWNAKDPAWQHLWKLPVAQRIKTFSWLLLKGRLLTNSERVRRKLTHDDLCSLCNGGTEDISHTFRDCPLSS